MKQETKQRLHTAYSLILTAMLVIAGICLIVACLGIYHSGDKPFTPESVAAAFSGIALPVYLCLALILGGFILDGFLPRTKKNTPPEKQYGAILSRLAEKFDPNACHPELAKGILTQQRSRMIHRLITGALLVAGSVVFLRYGLNSANFHQTEITASMEKAMYVLLPCMAVPYGYAVFAAYHARSSIKKEIELVKQAVAPGAATVKVAPKQSRTNAVLAVRCVLLCGALVLLIYGFVSGGTKDVLTKAINICTECVGLG